MRSEKCRHASFFARIDQSLTPHLLCFGIGVQGLRQTGNSNNSDYSTHAHRVHKEYESRTGYLVENHCIHITLSMDYQRNVAYPSPHAGTTSHVSTTDTYAMHPRASSPQEHHTILTRHPSQDRLGRQATWGSKKKEGKYARTAHSYPDKSKTLFTLRETVRAREGATRGKEKNVSSATVGSAL
jgi:hypothetical protein